MSARDRWTWPLLGLLALVSLPVALLSGAAQVDLVRACTDSSSPDALILWSIRLPRLALGWVAGSGLALAGVLLQALFRNPLASPYTLGISSGAALGAGLVLAAAGGLAGGGAAWLTQGGAQGGALLGAALAGLLVFLLGRRSRAAGGTGLLLAGVAVGFTLSSLLLLVQVLADPSQSLRILRWLMGGLDAAAWNHLPLPALVVGLAALGAWVGARPLDLLSLGEETAHTRGLAVARLVAAVFWTSTALVAVVVAVCGPIGFVGLMAPHAARLLVGPGHRRLLPAALLLGGAFLVLCDALARAVAAPAELPVGVITACLGGPLFLILLLRDSRG